jgi:acetylornithine/N-succinyldiaminopimelate aminotransferase
VPPTRPSASLTEAAEGRAAVHAAGASEVDSTRELLAEGSAHLLGNYRQAPVVFCRGEGSTLVDTTGKSYLDFAAGVAVNALGHAHPALVATIAHQAATLMHVSNYFYNEENVRLAAELSEKTGYPRVFFCNSGAEANEAAFKLVRRHFFAKGDTGRYTFLSFDHSFHGRTLATVTLTGNASYSEGFGPKIEGVVHLPFGDLEAVRAAMGPHVAGIFVEPVQGEGGVLPAPEGFLAGLRALSDEHGALLVFDEVQTGIGRTGKLLGSEHDGVRADVVTLAKGLGGGFPIGAMLVREELANALPPGTHGSTFGGNALASAAARTVLRVLDEEGLIDAAAVKGAKLSALLGELAARHPDLCSGERGRGLLRGVVLKPGIDARLALGLARERGLLLTIAGGTVLRFTPPLVVTEAELEEGVRRLDDALRALRVELAA